jgi:hypothetical protein
MRLARDCGPVVSLVPRSTTGYRLSSLRLGEAVDGYPLRVYASRHHIESHLGTIESRMLIYFAVQDKWRFGLSVTNHGGGKIVTSYSNLGVTRNWLAFLGGILNHSEKVDGAAVEAFWLKAK